MTDENNKFKIYDRINGHYLSGEYNTRSRANTIADKKDNAYGAYRYSVEPISLKDDAWRDSKGELVKVKNKTGGGSGGVSDTKEMQLGADLDPKAMMKREGYAKGGKVKSASVRADGCAQRGKTRA